MLKSIWQVGVREIKKLYQDKKALLIVMFMPILYALLFGYLYSPNQVTAIKTAVINHSPSQISRTIIEGFQKSERFDISYHLTSEDEIRPLMEKGAIEVAIIIPENFTSNIKRGKSTDVLLGVNATNMIVSNGVTASALQIVKTYSTGITIKKFQSLGAPPISVSFRPWFNPAFSYTNYLLLGIITIAIQQILLMCVANSFAREKEEETQEELLSYAKNFFNIILGKFMTYFLFGVLSLLGTSLVAFKIYQIPLRGNFKFILFLGIPFIVSIISLGIIVSRFAKTQTEATQLAMLLAYPTFLVSGFTWPLMAMPQVLQKIAAFFPLTYFAEDLRKIALMGVGFEVLQGDLIRISIIALVYLGVAVVLFLPNGLERRERVCSKV